MRCERTGICSRKTTGLLAHFVARPACNSLDLLGPGKTWLTTAGSENSRIRYRCLTGESSSRYETPRCAHRDWMAGFGEDEIEAAVPSSSRRSSLYDALAGRADWQVAGDDPRWIAHIENACRTDSEHYEAAWALVSFDTISLAGAVALLEYVASVEAKDPEGLPDFTDDEDGRIRAFHYFLTINLAATLGAAS